MNIIIIGLGSMGKRRIRLLRRYFSDLNLYGVDSNVERRLFCENEYHIKTFGAHLDVMNDIEINCAFICTAPLSHSGIISECLKYGINVFTELNLVSNGYAENIKSAKEKGLILFLSSTALYRKETQYIIEKVQEDKAAVCYNYHVGQYLPDWHPWENYKDFFVGNKSTNGCRELLAIELPWIIRAFGTITDIHVIAGKITSLNLDYNDYYMIQLIHEGGNKGNLIVDIVSREAIRKLEVFSENIYIEWQGRPDTLTTKNLETKEMQAIQLYDVIDKLDNYSSSIIENQYLDEITAFFDEISQKKQPIYTFEDDLITLKIIDRIEGITIL